MSFNKYTGIVCIIITLMTVLVAIVFMNAEKLGVSSVTSDISADENGAFSDRDLDSSYTESSAIYIDLSEIDGYTSGGAYELDGDLYIATAGTYVLSGTLENNQVIVNASDAKVQIVLNGVTITNDSLPAIYVAAADKVFITLEEGSENVIESAGLSEEAAIAADVDAAIYSSCDLTINGSGSLIVTATGGHGVKSKDDLVITGGNITVTADDNCLVGKDSVRICDGILNLTAGNDAIKANNDSDEDKGYVTITGGEFTITADHDGISAVTYVDISGGSFDITTGGGYENAAAHADEMMPGGGNMGGGRHDMDGGNTPGNGDNAESSDTEETPEMGEAPDMNGDMPEMGEAPEMDGDMPEMGEAPEMDGDMPEMGEAPDMNGDNSESSDQVETVDASETEDEESDSSKAIKAGTKITISGGTIVINSSDDAIHSDGDLLISAGTITISTGDDGLHAENELNIENGTIVIETSYEGIEAYFINIYDGDISVTATDDGMNAGGGSDSFSMMGGQMPGGMNHDNMDSADAGSSDREDSDNINTDENSIERRGEDANASDGEEVDESDSEDSEIQCLAIYGGNIYVNAAGDGLDSNGDLIIYGGNIIVDGPENGANGSLDSGTESGGELIVNGGTVIALGSSGMLETFSDTSEQNSFVVVFDEGYVSGDVITITDPDGNVIYEYTTAKSGTAVTFSSADLVLGQTYTVSINGTTSEEITLDSVSSGSVSSMGGMMGPGNGGGHASQG